MLLAHAAEHLARPEALACDAGLEPRPWTSFPLPRWTGRLFTYDESNVLARVPGG